MMEDNESIDYEGPEAVSEAVQDSVGGQDIREQVRDITVAALVQGQLQPERFKRVVEAVLEGARTGAAIHGLQAGDVMKQALEGIDDAMSKIAVASKFAIEEAVGHGVDFTRVDLKRSMADLAAVESLFVDTLKELARSGSHASQEIVGDFIHHTVSSGSAVGRQVAEALGDLQQKLGNAGERGVRAGLEAAESTGAGIANLASGFLEGLAESLQARARGSKRKADH